MKAALFDLDGVIVDTEPVYSLFWGEMGRKYNVAAKDFANIIKGTTLTQILDRYFPDADTQKLIVDDLERYEANMSYPVFRYVEDYLRQLQRSGIPCAIVTSSNLRKLDNLWQQHPGLRAYFRVVITDEDVTRSKPDPQPYLIAASRLGCEPEDTYVFEDSINGLISGRRAGAYVVALSTTNPVETLRDYADMVIAGFDELLTECDTHPDCSRVHGVVDHH